MSLPSKIDFSMDSVFRTYQTFTVALTFPEYVDKTHFLYVREIDAKNNQAILETVDPKKNFTPEQWKNLAKEYKIFILGTALGGNVVLSVPEMYRDKIPTKGLKVLIETGEKVSALLEVNILQYFDNRKYGVVMKQYVEFFRFVAAHTKQQNQQCLIKK